MVIEKRMQIPVIENRYDAKCSLSVYIICVLQASSMQLHTFMLGVDVARYALLVISTLPFRTSGARKHAPNTIICILYVVMIAYGKCFVNWAFYLPLAPVMVRGHF